MQLSIVQPYIKHRTNQTLGIKSMKKIYPEIITIFLIVSVFILPPWSAPLKFDSPFFRTHWDFLWHSDGISSIDIKLLGLELAAIVGIYYLMKKLKDNKI